MSSRPWWQWLLFAFFTALAGCASQGGVSAESRKPEPGNAELATAELATVGSAKAGSSSAESVNDEPDSIESGSTDLARANESQSGIPTPLFEPLSVSKVKQSGNLKNTRLNEVSGLTASSRYPGVLYAINDSGNDAVLFAISETGESVAQWSISAANNRDWEDLTRIRLDGNNFLVVGDTGDNLKVHDSAVLYLFPEPEIPTVSDVLPPTYIVHFRFDEGPRNIEAFSAAGSSLYLLSKEPVNDAGRHPSHLYHLDLSQVRRQSVKEAGTKPIELIAHRIGTMAQRASNFETWLAASLAGVDLSHPTAMEFDESTNTAYVLTYREVLKITKRGEQSWAAAFAQKAERVLSHRLRQAEALSVSPSRAIWFTSEGIGAPIWSIPLRAPN